MNDLVNFYKLLSDQTRVRILMLLYHQELCVCEIFGIMEESQPKISKHLAKLRDLGVIVDKRKEQFIFYSLNTNNHLLVQTLENLVDNIDQYPILKNDIQKLKTEGKVCK